MIENMDKLQEKICACTQAMDDKFSGADGKCHIVLCGGTGRLSHKAHELLHTTYAGKVGFN